MQTGGINTRPARKPSSSSRRSRKGVSSSYVRWRGFTRSLWQSMRMHQWTTPSPRLTRRAQRRRTQQQLVLLAHCHSCMRPFPLAMGWQNGSGLLFPAMLPPPRAPLRRRDARPLALLGCRLRGVYRANMHFKDHPRHAWRARQSATAQRARKEGACPTYGGATRCVAAVAPQQRSNGGASARSTPRTRAACLVRAHARSSAGCRACAEQRQPLAVERTVLLKALASSASAAARQACARREAAQRGLDSARAKLRRLPGVRRAAPAVGCRAHRAAEGARLQRRSGCTPGSRAPGGGAAWSR